MNKSVRSLLLRCGNAVCVATSVGIALSSVHAESASNYQDVLDALRSNRPVKVLTDLDKCGTLGTGKEGPEVQGGLQISAFIILPEKGLFFSDVHQTLDMSGQPVTEFIRYNLGKDGDLTLTVTRQTIDGMVKQSPLLCHMGAGARFVW